MSLYIHRREREGIVVLDLEGPLTLGDSESAMREALQILREEGKVNIALNLEKVSRIDSTGLGMLVFALVKLRKAGGRFALFNLHPTHLHLLLLTKLVTVFELFTEEQDAVNSFFPDRATQHYDILNYVQSSAEAQRLATGLLSTLTEPTTKDQVFHERAGLESTKSLG